MKDSVRNIIAVVGKGTGVSLAQLRDNGSRHRKIVVARVIASGLLDECALLSTHGIAAALGTSPSATSYRLQRWRKRRLRERRMWLDLARKAVA